MNYDCLINRPIINVLIGDTPVYNDYKMPSLSGPELCTLSTQWGVPVSYHWGGTNKSRWEYMDSLLRQLNRQERTSEFLAFMFDFQRFQYLRAIKNADEIKATHKNIVDGAIQHINATLLFSQQELRIIDRKIILCKIDEDPIIAAPKVKIVTYQYIRELPERIKEDLENTDYDSVVTKSRTLLEEVLIYIIEQTTKERYKSDGNLLSIYNEVRDLLGIKQQTDWDKRVNELLGGIYKIVNSIANMRNMNSDAHGAGCGRIIIHKREAMLIANSAMMIAEYWLNVFNKEKE